MKFMLALLAAVGFASALPEPVAGGGGYGKLTTQCYHTSTCKAVYYTKQKSYTKPVYVDATRTAYKPVTVTTEVPKTYTETKVYTQYTTIASVITVTKTQPVKVETSKVVCKTYPSYYYTNKEYPSTETKYIPSSTVKSETKPVTKNEHSTYTTSTPYPETYKSKSETIITTAYTGSYSKCWPKEYCTTKKKEW